ncbi:MAG: thiamine diphosphokinase [Ignavibacteria bacterium]|nr:thiamine diphosphokinase [Ignavibacteria bacterium]
MRSSNLKTCIIVSNGKIYKKDLKHLLEINKPRRAISIIACDGASDFLKSCGVIPDIIIGDLDSAKPDTLKYFSKKEVIIKKVFDQNKNDLEKAIIYALSKKFKLINIVGFGGKRLDHTLNNLSILKKFHRKAKIRIYENGFVGEIIGKSAEFECKPGNVVSLIPLPKAAGVTTSGLKYSLKNGTLESGVREGALNEAMDKTFRISLLKGHLLILFRK